MKGFIGAVKLGAGVLSIFTLLTLLMFYVVPVFSSEANSIAVGGAFNVTYDSSPLYINWSSDIINVTGKVDGLVLYIQNGSTRITANYTQNSFYTTSPKTYPNLDTTNYAKCFTSGSNTGMKFNVQNASSGIFSNTSQLNTGSMYWLLNLSAHTECPPGRYYGYFNILNKTNSSFTSSSSYANVTALIDVTINKNNTLNNATLSGPFYGRFPGNYTDYHSYYFNTSEFENASSLTLTLSGFSENLDLFLFDTNGDLVNASTNKGSVTEKISYLHLPYNQRWEVRIFGNVSANQDYTGNLYFSRIDVNVSSMDFGTLDPKQDKSSVFRMNNTDSQNVTGVNEIAEVYRFQIWDNQTTGFNVANYSTQLLVPKFATQVMIKIEWSEHMNTGNVSNWTLRVTDPNGNLLGTSQGHYHSANVTNATATEYVTVTSVGLIREGYWNITVMNASNDWPLNPYNISAYVWFNASKWISTNFTNSTLLEGFGNASVNNTYDINVSITVPDEGFINGSYRGFLRYTNSSGWEINVPLRFDVKAGLLILNQNMSNATTIISINDNIGFNRNRFMNITYNNTGGYDIYFNYTTSSFNLTNGGSWINFTVDSLPGVTTGVGHLISAYSASSMDITLNVTNITTNDKTGTYSGWLAFNTSIVSTQNMNDTTRSYPYGSFNLSLSVNLNNNVTINISGIPLDSQGGLGYVMENKSTNGTFMFNFSVTLANGTRVPLSYPALISRIWINESNITSYGANLNATSQGKAAGMCDNGFCYVNASLRQNLVGGKYIVYINATYDTGRMNLTGTGSYNYLHLNNTGLNITITNNGAGTTTRSIGTIDEDNFVYFNTTVSNYGNQTANSKFSLSGCSYVTIESYASRRTNNANDCRTSKTSDYFMLDIPAEKTCWFSWKITASAIDDSNKTCTGTNLISLNATESGFGNITDITLTVGNADASASEGDDDNGDGGSPTAYDRSLDITNHESSLTAVLGETVKTNITVKNTGDVSTTVKIDSVTIDGMTTSFIPSYCNLGSSNSCDFEVTFNIDGDTNIGIHSGTYRVCTSGYCDTYYDTENFIVTVLPTPERETEINESYQNLSAVFQTFVNQFNTIKPSLSGLVSENNLTRVEGLVSDTTTLIEQAWAAIISGDYITAEESLTEADEKISMISNGIADLQKEADTNRALQGGGIWLWVIIGVIIAGAAGFLIYMLMPTSGYHPKYGYHKQSTSKNIKIFFKRKGRAATIKSRMNIKGVRRIFSSKKQADTEYARHGVRDFYEGYKYEKSSSPSSRLGFNQQNSRFFGKIKKMLKRSKQHDISDYTKS
jgi:hypothetical protein